MGKKMDHPKARVFRREKKVSDSYTNKLGPYTWEENFWALEKNEKQKTGVYNRERIAHTK